MIISYKDVIHKEKLLYLVFISFYQYVISPKSKLYFKNFPQLCKTSQIKLYESNTIHPFRRERDRIREMEEKKK